MGETVKLTYHGKTYEFPVLEGSCGEKAFDISTLRSETGLITFDPGFLSTGSCESKITHLEGEKGKLLYRGIPIEQLAEKSTFLETAYHERPRRKRPAWGLDPIFTCDGFKVIQGS